MNSNRSPSRRTFVATGIGAVTWAMGPALAQSPDPAALTLTEAARLLRSKAASPVDLTQACLKRIEKLNPAVNAFITISGESALASAREMEAEAQKGKWRGPLHGIPIALKDNIDTAGIRTTGASELFKDRVPTEDAEVVRRLKNAGAIILGKLNMHEFAYGATSAVTYFGAVHNPWALDRISGGSSGGSAAAIAAGLCFGTLGTDTGGSIRIPSSDCGVVGLMPTYGRVSNRGVIPMAWTLDHVGPICKTVEDAAIMLGVIAGYDDGDPTTVDTPVPDYSRGFKMPVSKLRLGLPRVPFFDNLDPEFAKALDVAIEVLRKLTASVTEVRLPPSVAGPIVWGPETYAYHAKWLKESPEKYQPATRAQMVRANEVKPEVYAEARRQVDLARREIKKVFTTVDLLATPTLKVPPTTIAASLNPLPNPGAGNPGNPWAFDVYGIPAITLPCGFTSSGLPIGLQISAAPFAETTMLALAHAYERATDWTPNTPSLGPDNLKNALERSDAGMKLILVLALAWTGLAETYRFEPTEFHNTFSGAHKPVLRIKPGDHVTTYTIDAGGVDSKGVQRGQGPNPETGPFYIEGAEPGDTLVVHLLRLETNRATGFSASLLAPYTADPGFLRAEALRDPKRAAWQIDKQKGVAYLDSNEFKGPRIELPLRPMLGCVATAPANRAAIPTSYPDNFGGNMDYNGMGAGATVMLPVFEPGALFFLGDGHARQGDGEVVGSAIETSLDVEFSVDLIKGKRINWPRLENQDYIMVLGSSRALNEALQHATTELMRWLMDSYGFDERGASLLMGQGMEYDISNVVDPEFTIVAKMRKRYLGSPR